ncbi:C40 family peptidase [Flavisericum labens]|uniref:C40 family peptidase n=1 Tax=Flavisericum labens TaxID=3377112 RepID=UPI00387ACEBB
MLILLIGFGSCKSSKRARPSKVIITKKDTNASTVSIKEETNSAETQKRTSKDAPADYIINYAKQFEGVRYKWGGTTKSGMDCSGLVYESFKSYDIILPRTSKDMAKRGKKIALKRVLNGDLLFFKTGNRRNSINHVGLIVAIRNNDIEFIHATSSKGVIISNLNTPYWLSAFHEARRVL